ncbi:hypothetical protein VTN49DRAFT_3132 [Thermomyces lanuginosus]|uniref:uncharacterized protein n=1 Tax=Thermomyces lanuginosus TaxID=5541 RepID=UPI0037449DB1
MSLDNTVKFCELQQDHRRDGGTGFPSAPMDTSKKDVVPPRSERPLSTFERVISTHAPIFESLLLQIPTDTLFQLYHTSSYLRRFLQSYPTAWKYLSFRLLFLSGFQPRPLLTGSRDPAANRQSRPYALDQLLMMVVMPISPCLKSLELDNTAVSGQILISTVLHTRRETLEHLSVRGCKNVSLKYHIVPYLTLFSLQNDADQDRQSGNTQAKKKLALKSLYTYRCRHHRRRPYLTSSLLRRDSDSEPTHELVLLCHTLGIWTDTAWCPTPAGRCFRRRGYVSMRVPHGAPEVWVVFDRLWRSRNWLGPSSNEEADGRRDSSSRGKLWEHEVAYQGEPLGVGEQGSHDEGKMVPTHLRRSHRVFVENIKCDQCFADIPERCEQCSVSMHCVGCRKTLCASCAFDRPYLKQPAPSTSQWESAASQFLWWWAPGVTVNPCVMQDPVSLQADLETNPQDNPMGRDQQPNLEFRWCCTEPLFSGGGGISIGTATSDVDQIRAVPLPRGKGYEDPEFTDNEWNKDFPRYAYGNPERPDYSLETGHIEMMRWLLGPPDRPVSNCPRNLCKDCYNSPQWKVHCKSCSKPLCIEHDLRGLRLRICGYRDLTIEKMALQNKAAGGAAPRESTPVRLRPTALDSGLERVRQPSPSAASSDLENQIETPAERELDRPMREVSEPTRAGERSASPTNSLLSRTSSRSSVYYDASTGTPRWQGCQSFFCPQYRPVGDQRQRCTSVLRECTGCSVHVCQDCIAKNPPCTCSYCEANYLCPNCQKLREEDGTCRRAEEERQKAEEEFKKSRELLNDMIARTESQSQASSSASTQRNGGGAERQPYMDIPTAEASGSAEQTLDMGQEANDTTSDEEAVLNEMMASMVS